MHLPIWAQRHDVRVAADIPAGFGYLAGGAATIAAEVILIRNRRRDARSQIERWVSSASKTRPGLRWLHGRWTDERWHDESFRERNLVWVWLPPVLFCPVLASVLVAAAVAEFLR